MKIEDLFEPHATNVIAYNHLAKICKKHNISCNELDNYISEIGAELKWQSIRTRRKNVIGIKLKEIDYGGYI